MSGEESALANKYLELCQVLVQKGQAFSFSLKTNPFFISLDTKEKAPILEPRKVRKKLSPSALRRNQKRKEIFLKNKSNLSDEQQLEESIKVVDTQSKCDQCERTFQSESGLKIHVGRAHKDSNLTHIETLRSYSEATTLMISPVKEARREEKCECCGEVMAPDHKCGEEDLSCHDCEKEFSCEEDLVEHLKSIHPTFCHICYIVPGTDFTSHTATNMCEARRKHYFSPFSTNKKSHHGAL